MRALLIVLVSALLFGCGVKGPPKPPLEPNRVEAPPDAGVCCTDRAP